jgi:hypothetical protein
LLSLLSSATSLRLQPARHRIIFILSRRNDWEAKRSIPSHAGTAQALERAVPFPSRQLPTSYHPLRSNSQDESLARTDLLYPALCFLPGRKRDRETTAHEQHSYPTHTFEKRHGSPAVAINYTRRSSPISPITRNAVASPARINQPTRHRRTTPGRDSLGSARENIYV